MIRILFLLLLSTQVFATNYYVKNSGSDAATGTSDAQAWATLAKVQASLASMANGDVIYLKAGDVFAGSLISIKQITITKYGVGANPKISGFVSVASWVNLGGNIWESATAVSSLSSCNMVTINDTQFVMGRFPNENASAGGYLTYNTTGNNLRVKCTALGGTDWTGADAVLRLNRFVATRNTILSQSVDTITYSALSVYVPSNNYGLFIENDIRTLDTTGEWYFNPFTKKLSLYSLSTPSNVRLSVVDTLVTISSAYVTIDSVDFEGSNRAAIARDATSNSFRNLTVKNATINFSGGNAIDMRQRDNINCVFENIVINNTNNNGLQAGVGCLNSVVRNVTTNTTGMNLGMVQRDINFSPIAINVGAQGVVIENCTVLNSGYVGIASQGSGVTIQNNVIRRANNRLDDGALLYFNNGSGNTTTSNILIKNNILSESEGAPFGAGTVIVNYGEGIYLDDNTNGVTVSNNTITGCAKDAILLHNARNCTIVDNLTYDNRYGLSLSDDFLGDPITGLVVKRNQFVAKTTAQYAASFYSTTNNVTGFGNLDSNLYTRPILDSAIIKMEFPNMGWGFRTLAHWNGYSGKDAASYKAPFAISNVSQFEFTSNATAAPSVLSFPGSSKKDFTGLVIDNGYTILPYGSILFTANGSAVPPAIEKRWLLLRF